MGQQIETKQHDRHHKPLHRVALVLCGTHIHNLPSHRQGRWLTSVNPDGVGEVGSMACGDALKLSFKLDENKKIIKESEEKLSQLAMKEKAERSKANEMRRKAEALKKAKGADRDEDAIAAAEAKADIYEDKAAETSNERERIQKEIEEKMNEHEKALSDYIEYEAKVKHLLNDMDEQE